MLIHYATIHRGVLKNYSLTDELDFGKYCGHTVEDIITHYPGYMARLLENQTGFGLNRAAIDLYDCLEGTDRAPYPEHKLPLTEAIILPRKKQITIPETNKIINFQPILGVNIMKKVILVAHDNKYQSGPEAFYGDNGAEYSYFTDLGDLEVDDFVVVDCTNGLQVCRVTRIVGLTPSQIHKAHKWVVAKIDMTAHERNLNAQEKIQEIQNKVAERKAQIEGQIILKQMAKEDPTMMSLLQELGSLDSNLVPACLLENTATKEPDKEES